MSHSILYQILILIGSATVVATIFHFLKIPTIVGFIVAGAMIGPAGLALVGSLPGAQILSEFAALLLMFTIGLEISITRLKAMRRSFLGLGGLQVLLTILLVGAFLRWVVGLPWPGWIFFGCIAALSSTAIIIKLLEEDRDIASPYGNAAIGALIFQDLAVIPFMLLIPVFKSPTLGGLPAMHATEILMIGFKFIAAIALLWLGAKFLVPNILRQIVRTKSQELFFFAVLLLCFGVAFGMEKLGVSLSLGAFVAGMTIAESVYGRQVAASVLPMRDSFLGLFFVSIGMLLDLHFVMNHAFSIALVGLAIFAIKMVVTYGAARATRYQPAIAFVVALLLFQIGEFSFILAAQGLNADLISFEQHQYFLSVAVLSMMLTPFVYRHAPRWGLSGSLFDMRGELGARSSQEIRDVVSSQVRSEKSASAHQFDNHTVIIGYGYAGKNIADALMALQVPQVIIEMNYDLLSLSSDNKKFIYGDATKRHILEHAGLESAKLVIIATSGAQMATAILRAIRAIRPDIEVILRSQYVRDLELLRGQTNLNVVVSELESALELVARALRCYGASWRHVEDFILQTRKNFHGKFHNLRDSIRQNIDLPKWEAVSAIRPTKLDQGHSISQSLGKLRLRELTGATVVAVYRDGLGTTVPGPDFVLEQNDVVYLIGEPASVDMAESYLRRSNTDAES